MKSPEDEPDDIKVSNTERLRSTIKGPRINKLSRLNRSFFWGSGPKTRLTNELCTSRAFHRSKNGLNRTSGARDMNWWLTLKIRAQTGFGRDDGDREWRKLWRNKLKASGFKQYLISDKKQGLGFLKALKRAQWNFFNEDERLGKRIQLIWQSRFDWNLTNLRQWEETGGERESNHALCRFAVKFSRDFDLNHSRDSEYHGEGQRWVESNRKKFWKLWN